MHVAWRSSEAAAQALRAEFGERVHRADLEQETEARHLVERVVSTDGRLDVLVHAVGAYARGPLAGAHARTWRDLAASNVESALHAYNRHMVSYLRT